MSIKYNDDYYYYNDHYSKIGGISCDELDKMEAEMLNILNYDLYVSDELYEYCLGKLKNCEVESPLYILSPIDRKNMEEDFTSAQEYCINSRKTMGSEESL